MMTDTDLALSSATYEVADAVAANELYQRNGWTDGLPIVPPTEEAVRAFLRAQTDALLALGVQPGRIVWDSGVGFGKTVAQNFSLLARQRELLSSGFPLLAGWSRKSSLGRVTGLEVDQRLIPSVAAALLAVEHGARIVRVHDVLETVQALKVWNATISIA